MAITQQELHEMWKRPVERQYNVAMAKMVEAIRDTQGDISLCFSGGKDSALMLDMYAEVIGDTPYRDKPIRVIFADTTIETNAMRNYIREFIPYVENKWHVAIDFTQVRPAKKMSWAKFVLENGIPLISKDQAKRIRAVKADMMRTECDYQTVTGLYMGGGGSSKSTF